MKALKGILFDYSNTILVTDKFDAEAGFKDALGHCELPDGTRPDRVIQFAVETEMAFQEMRDRTELEYSFTKVMRVIVDYFPLKTHLSMLELEEIYYTSAVTYQAAPGVKDFIDKARSNGLILGVVSNSNHGSPLLKTQLNLSGLSDSFDLVISSADYGIRKQQPLLYQIALSKIGLKKHQVVFIGDSLEYDIATAQAAGIAAVWYNRKNQPAIAGIKADLEFSNWLDINLERLRAVLKK